MKLRKSFSALLLGMVILTGCKTDEKKLLLPVLGEKHAEGKDTLYHTVPGFTLVDQDGRQVTEKTVKNKIYIANFFFATCQSICPEMSTNLVKVQADFANDDSLLILSHSVNP